MRFGLHLPNAGLADGEGLLAVAKAAEDMGYDSVWLYDHLFTPTQLESAYPYSPDGSYPMNASLPFFDPVAVMGALAAATSRIRFGVRVLIATYRHPVVLAKELATIDAIAGGRMVLGVGAGWMAEEFAAVGVPMEARGARLEEHIALMRTVWEKGTASFDGRFYSVEEAGFRPQPPQPGNRIPVLIGGHSDAALRRAARIGDGWAAHLPGGVPFTPEALAQRLDQLRSYCDEEGRDFDDLLILGHAGFDVPEDPEFVGALAEIGVDEIDYVAFGTAEMIIDAGRRFLDKARPAVS